MTAALAPAPERPTAVRRPDLAGRWLAATLLVTAGLVHVWVVPEHLDEWRPAGLFFAAVAVCQFAAALVVLTWPRLIILLAAMWSTVALIGVWVWSRTSGLPFGPLHLPGVHESLAEHNRQAVGGRGNGVPIFPGQSATTAEDVGVPDLIALGLELALILVLLSLLTQAQQRRQATLLAFCGVVLLGLRATVLS